MELDELKQRLVPFCRAKYDDPEVRVEDVHRMPGHAGFSYGFTASRRSGEERWVLRLPPPGVSWRGTADVMRQVAILNALDGTEVPHCSVRWAGDAAAELAWFGRPYFVVPMLEGDVLRLGPGEWGAALAAGRLRELGRQAMTALAGIHRVDWRRDAPHLGEPIPFAEDVTRWDRFLERGADPERLAGASEVRERLLATLPDDAPIGVFHGDFQTSNLFCAFDGNLKAVIDFELVGVGATLNDVGWIATFSDVEAWPQGAGARPMFLDPETLIGFYEEAWGERLPDLAWYRALAAYKFAVITGFNLMLHRRGKRHDPVWETSKLAMPLLIERARTLLGAGRA